MTAHKVPLVPTLLRGNAYQGVMADMALTKPKVAGSCGSVICSGSLMWLPFLSIVEFQYAFPRRSMGTRDKQGSTMPYPRGTP